MLRKVDFILHSEYKSNGPYFGFYVYEPPTANNRIYGAGERFRPVDQAADSNTKNLVKGVFRK